MSEEETLSLTARIRSRMDLVPASMRSTVERLLERLRTTLDLPSRAEMADLTRRLEELDRRIAELSVTRVSKSEER